MTRLKIALLAGGDSPEREIALQSAALIEGGQVSLNFFEENKISREVGEGDILAIRGYGRYVLSKVGSVSKKGRLHLTLGKYV